MKCYKCNGTGTYTDFAEIERNARSVTMKKMSTVCDVCNGSGQRPQTNADRVRSMSDEELIKFFGHNGLCSYIQDNDKEWCDKRLACGNCLARWLQQPAKECE